jgi:hypothetical protein
MSAIGFKEKTTSTPEKFVAALTDFGAGPLEDLWEQRMASGNACATTGPTFGQPERCPTVW